MSVGSEFKTAVEALPCGDVHEDSTSATGREYTSTTSPYLNTSYCPEATYSAANTTYTEVPLRTASAYSASSYQTTILDANNDMAEIPPPPSKIKAKAESKEIWENRNMICDKHKRQKKKVVTTQHTWLIAMT